MGSDAENAESASLQDQRDGLVQQLSEFFDLQVYTRSDGRQTISTTGGLQLFDGVTPVKLSFDGRSAIAVTGMMALTAVASATVFATVVRPAERRGGRGRHMGEWVSG